MGAIFNYQFFLKALKTSMNAKTTNNNDAHLGKPYIGEIVLWSIVDNNLFKSSDKEKEKHSYDHSVIKDGNSFNFDYKKEVFDESTHFVRNPRFESMATCRYFYELGEAYYPFMDKEKDANNLKIDYINRFFDYMNSKETKNDYTIECDQTIDYRLLAKQWNTLAKILHKRICTKAIEKEAEELSFLGNSDLHLILTGWKDAASQVPPSSGSLARDFCENMAVLFLRSVAVSVMLTDEEVPQDFSLLSGRLKPYMEYESRLEITDTNSDRAKIEEDIQKSYYELFRTFTDVISVLNAWKLDQSVTIQEREVGLAYSLLREFRHIYNGIKKDPSCLKIYDRYYRDIFFTVVNNPVIQQRVVFVRQKEFAFLFELYTAWINYIRFKEVFEGDVDEEYYIDIMRKFDLTDRRIINDLLYSRDTPVDFDILRRDFSFHTFRIRLATADDMPSLHKMHNPKGGWDPKIFINSSDKGLKYATGHDQCWIIEDISQNKIACCSIIVPIEYTDEDLKMYSGMRKCQEEFGKKYENEGKSLHFSEFNSIIVAPEYRGLGFQRLMISMCYWFAATDGDEYLKNGEPVYVGAEVSPINPYSHDNFDKMGYDVASTIVFEDHENVSRDFVVIKVAKI